VTERTDISATVVWIGTSGTWRDDMSRITADHLWYAEQTLIYYSFSIHQ